MDGELNAVRRWLDRATGLIRFAPDREAAKAELAAHLEDKAADLQRIFPGMAGEEAQERALAQMGDPEEIGQALAKIHKPWLGWLWRASRLLLAALLLLLAVVLCGLMMQQDLFYGVQDLAEEWSETREGRVIAGVLYGSGTLQEMEAVMEARGASWDGKERLALYQLGRTARLGEAALTLSEAALWRTEEGRALYIRVQLAYDRARDRSEVLPYYLQAEDSLGNCYGHELTIREDGASMSGFGFLGRESRWNGWTWNFCIDDLPEEAEWVRLSYALRPAADLDFFIDLTQEETP